MSRFWEEGNVEIVSFVFVSIGAEVICGLLMDGALTDTGPGLISPEDARCFHMGSGLSILIDMLSSQISLKI